MLSRTKDRTGLDRWRKKLGDAEADRQSKAAADRGTLVHAYVEKYLLLDAKDDESIDAFTRAAWEVMKDGGQTEAMAYKLRQEVRGKAAPWCLEVPLWSPTLRVAGCVDFVGTWKGFPIIADWKTSRTPKQEEWDTVKDYKLQCTAYALMHNEQFGTDIQDILVLIACETGEVQTFTGKVADHKDALLARIDAYYEIEAENYLASLAA